jgi:hypothetical protein
MIVRSNVNRRLGCADLNLDRDAHVAHRANNDDVGGDLHAMSNVFL